MRTTYFKNASAAAPGWTSARGYDGPPNDRDLPIHVKLAGFLTTLSGSALPFGRMLRTHFTNSFHECALGQRHRKEFVRSILEFDVFAALSLVKKEFEPRCLT